MRVKKNLKVKIPVGVNNGSTLRVRGEGDAGPRGYVFPLVLLLIVCCGSFTELGGEEEM